MKFLRSELETLHERVRSFFHMMGRDVSINTFSYELAYAQKDPFAGDPPYMDVLMPYLAGHAPPPASVLDIGSGTGRLAIPLAKEGYRVTMLDPAASGLRRAYEKAQAAGVSDNARQHAPRA